MPSYQEDSGGHRSQEHSDEADVGPFGPGVDAFDEMVDEWFAPLRNHPITDRAMYIASTLGDFSLIWHLLGAWRGVLPGGRPRDAVRLSMVMGIESLVVNQGIKRLFGRVRPRRHDDGEGLRIRQPITSSFPSGHASAAMTAAAVLARRGRFGPAYYLLGVIVAASRIHVRMHHASDVVAGAAVGVAIGKIATRVLDSLDG